MTSPATSLHFGRTIRPNDSHVVQYLEPVESLDAQDPDWEQIARFSRARLSVAISITGHVVGVDGTPVSPPLTDKAVARGSATVRIPHSVLAAHR